MPSVNGVASGLDIDSLIKASLIFPKRQISLLEAKLAVKSAEKSIATKIGSNLATLESSADAVKKLGASLMKVTSSETDALTATATSKARAGSHQVVVKGLAQAHRLGAAGFADKNTTAVSTAGGKFEVRVGSGTTVSVDVTTSTTLQGLVDAINAKKGDVVASIVNDGSSTNAYRMVLTAKNEGAANVVKINTNNTTLNFATNSYEQPVASSSNATDYTGTVSVSGTYTGTASRGYMVDIMTEGAVGVATYRVSLDGGVTWDDNSGSGYTTSSTAATLGGGTTPQGLSIAFSNSGTLKKSDKFNFDAFNPTLREARDANAVIDGITVRSATNTISSAVEGLTFTLKEADATETLNVAVTRSVAQIQGTVGAFVKAYNDLVGSIRAEQKYDKKKKVGGNLMGDAVANRVVRDVAAMLSKNVEGATGTYKSLVEVGLTVSKTGVLSLNETALKKALEKDTDSVLEVLQGASTASVSTLTIAATPASVKAGKHSVNVTQAGSKATVNATAAMSGNLTATEKLSFSYSSDQGNTNPTQKNFSVTLNSGRSITQIVADLNDAFKSQGVAMAASDNSGTLRIESKDFGTDYKITVSSDQSGAGSTQIGTSTITGKGVNIAGLIAGKVAKGVGATLTAEGGNAKGLSVTYEGTTTGVIGTVSVVRGGAAAFSDLADFLGDNKEGPVQARQKKLDAEIKIIEQRIAEKKRLLAITEKRVRAQFTALDVNLGRINAQGASLLQSLGSLQPFQPNNGNSNQSN